MAIVSTDTDRVGRIAAVLSNLQSVLPANFAPGCMGQGLFPPIGHPRAVDFFFAVTLHQYGFWSDDGTRYLEPYYGMLDGIRRKGAEFMFRAFWKTAETDPDFLLPDRQASLTAIDLRRALAEDDGICRIPMFESHLNLASAYGRHLVDNRIEPSSLASLANVAPYPFEFFRNRVGHIPGYAEDPLEKKLSLLAIILKNRPEHFLEISNADLIPIVDYHIQRTFLRTGMVELDCGTLRTRVSERCFLTSEEESAIRTEVYRAVELLSRVSGKDIAALDWFFFSLRRKCYEMEAPDCGTCGVNAVCAHHVELFQPVIRTTFY